MYVLPASKIIYYVLGLILTLFLSTVPASPPGSVMAVNISSTAIRVSWNPVPPIHQNGVITEYEVEYNQTTFSEVSMYNTTTVNSTTLMVDLTGLKEDVLYSIRVRAYTSVGAGPYSGVVMERTQEECKYYHYFLEIFFKYHCNFSLQYLLHLLIM